ncbi:hypothetical protein ACQKP5_05880 [Pseudomonas vancouverensis]|uniref:hypothetical protein n=1 Tax=Pseudomonas vancouverensis TaxID=95300 RepID=UPI003CFF3224
MKKSMGWLGVLAALSVSSAVAETQEIRALFQPDPSQPNKNVFVNQTPNSGYCASFPTQCASFNMFSIQVPIRFNGARSFVPGDAIPIKVPANWRQLTVTNRETQETETLEVRITGIGSQYELSETAQKLTGAASALEGHQKLWTTNSWVYAPAPCLYSGVGAYSESNYRFFWRTPVEDACTKAAAFNIPSIRLNTLDFAYELRTPNPLGMSSGLYTGSLHYSVGTGMDFDTGPMFYADDPHLKLNFVLDVQHTLKVDLPPGGNKVSLEPAGGWQQWIDGGRKPTSIYRDQLFYISASSRFKVMMQCRDSLGGDRCRMFGAGGNVTDVRTRLTLPAGLTQNGGGPVHQMLLLHNSWAGPFQPGQYLERKEGMLRFEIPSDAINSLLRPGVSGTMSTQITIIWDSEV